MKPNTRQPKLVGEWVELKFMVCAAEAGLTVSKPYGDSARFDFVVGQRAPLHRVQVRGTSVFSNRSYLCLTYHGGRQHPFTTRDVDFFAVYVIPCDAWYIVPMHAITSRYAICLYPHVLNSRSRMEQFREAWHLLAAPASTKIPRSRSLSR